MKRRSTFAVGRSVPSPRSSRRCSWRRTPPAAARAEPRLTVARAALSAASRATERSAAASAPPILFAPGTGSDGSQVYAPRQGGLRRGSAAGLHRLVPGPHDGRHPGSVQYLVHAVRDPRAPARAGPWRWRASARAGCSRAWRSPTGRACAREGDRRRGRGRDAPRRRHRRPAPRVRHGGLPARDLAAGRGSRFLHALERRPRRDPGRAAWTTVRSAPTRSSPRRQAPPASVLRRHEHPHPGRLPGPPAPPTSGRRSTRSRSRRSPTPGHRGAARRRAVPVRRLRAPLRHRPGQGADRAVPRSRRAAVRPGTGSTAAVCGKGPRNCGPGSSDRRERRPSAQARTTVDGGRGHLRVLAARRVGPGGRTGRAGLQRRLLRLRAIRRARWRPAGRALRTRARGGGSPPRLRLPRGDGRSLRRPRGGDVRGRDGRARVRSGVRGVRHALRDGARRARRQVRVHLRRRGHPRARSRGCARGRAPTATAAWSPPASARAPSSPPVATTTTSGCAACTRSGSTIRSCPPTTWRS